MLRLHEVMTTAPITIEPNAEIAEAARLMAEREVSHLVVLDEQDLVGVMCACDLDAAVLDDTVAEHMSRDPLTLPSDVRASVAARVMQEHDVSCVPVTRQAKLVGIVTLSDLRRAHVVDPEPTRCAACGSDDHVRGSGYAEDVGFCLECRRSSGPPGWDDEVGGG